MVDEKNFLGLDIGTNSIGWAVTNEQYNLRKFHNNLMWGVHLFDEAEQSAERRTFRTARRRLERRKQRISLLQEFFAKEILKVDKTFFMRLKESSLLPEDSEHRTNNIFFDDEDFTDKEYFENYPTIHHLICELMQDKSEHDVRQVYLACAYILSHRGHFLYSVDKDSAEKITDFTPLHDGFINALTNICETIPFDSDPDKMSEILRSDRSVTEKSKCLTELWFTKNKPKNDLCSGLRFDCLIKLLSGGTVKLSDLFLNESYKDLDKNSISVLSADFTDTLDSMYGILEDDQWELLDAVKKLCDQSLLVRSLGECSSISAAKADVYKKHQKDLHNLKYICKKYLTQKQYCEIFKDTQEKSNYSTYVYNGAVKNKKCSQEDFCKFVLKFLESVKSESSDKPLLDELIDKCKNFKLCPKQKTTDNRVIPYQLYYAELKQILENASAYLPFLNDKDEYGTVADKILSIMEFRIPYYVGPLVSSEKSNFAWMERKAEGKIYPWNYHEKIDLDKTENAFIRRMTCKCTYLAGEDVLPKNSLLYCKFSVLNEINNITVDGSKISVSAKQRIFNELFMKKQRVTIKAIENCLKACGEFKDGQSIGGIDVSIKSSLKSYHDFKRLLESGALKETDAERIIERITATTDTARLKKWLKNNYIGLSDADLKYLSSLNYKDYGRLSRKLLEEIWEIDTNGEAKSDRNIINALWETNDNLMQILGSKYRYGNVIEKYNADFYSDPTNHKTIEERMKEMYIPTAVRRSVTRTLDIVKEVKSIIGKDPDKIFIEMARESNQNNKGKRTKSRREQIKELYNLAKDMADKERLNELYSQLDRTDDGRLRSEKYYLYFIQLGRCMYTGHAIDFERLGNDTYYNIDHIYPQAKVKDDSLENKVLVESEANGAKGDKYPISADIKQKMRIFWNALRDKGLIGEKKYQRLTRSTNFTEEELAGFISRQLVETRQSTKAVAELIKEICPNSRIIYVKAGLTSEFRQEMDMLKCREVNDLHHAKDAYLNIVMGNGYNTQFTENPLNFIKSGEQYSLKIFKRSQGGKESGLLTRRVARGENIAWDPSVSFDIVKKMMSKNSIRYVRYCYRRKGGLFNQLPERKSEGLVERKQGLDTAKYGGYNNTTASYFSLVKYGGAITFIPVELMYAEKYSSSKEYAENYAAKQLSIILNQEINANEIIFPLGDRAVKINTLIEIDGFRANITCKSSGGKNLGISSAVSLILDKKHYDYAKRISSFTEKYKTDKRNSAENSIGISCENNIELFDVLVNKMLSVPFKVKLGDTGNKVNSCRENFEKLSLTEQTVTLANILSLLKTGRSTGCDLKSIGGKDNAGALTINSTISKIKGINSIYIIDQSPTGLYEKRSPNLLTL